MAAAPRQTPLTIAAEISTAAGGSMIAVGAVEITTAAHHQSVWANGWLIAGLVVLALAVVLALVRIVIHLRGENEPQPHQLGSIGFHDRGKRTTIISGRTNADTGYLSEGEDLLNIDPEHLRRGLSSGDEPQGPKAEDR